MPKGDYVKDFEMIIYDRWGMKLFETNSIDKGWNGTANGNNTVCQEDTYVYSATATDARGNIHNYSGQINLIK
jgi:gliding motility-associated-like protein